MRENVLIMGLGAGLFSAFCPSWYVLSSASFQSHQAANIHRTRWGMGVATSILLFAGASLSGAARQGHAFYTALFISMAFIAAYEYRMRNPGEEGSL